MVCILAATREIVSLLCFYHTKHMKFTPRPYQAEAISIATDIFADTKGHHGHLFVEPTGAGKSIMIAGAANSTSDPVLVLQPNAEILKQNFAKLVAIGESPEVYSASLNRKKVARITLATIGSIYKKTDTFKVFKNIIIDEAHLCNPYLKDGMYKQLFREIGNCRKIGLTATPYIMCSNSFGVENRFLTRMSGTFFPNLSHVTQSHVLTDGGFLSKMEYFRTSGLDSSMLKLNSAGTDYTDESVKAAMESQDIMKKAINLSERLMAKGRKRLVVYFRFVEDAIDFARKMGPGTGVVHGKMGKEERRTALARFAEGADTIMANVGVLTTGYDLPILDTVLITKPVRSMSLFCQISGRPMRPHPDKVSGYVVDMCGNINMHGHPEKYIVGRNFRNEDCVMFNGKQVTNVFLPKNREVGNVFDM